MFDILKNEQFVNVCIIILVITTVFITLFNFNKINNYNLSQENYCGCDQPVLPVHNGNIQLNSLLVDNNINNNNNVNNISNNNNVNNIDNNNINNINNNNKLILYYAMWCGYSRQFLPIWEQIKSAVEQTPDLHTDCVQYDCEAQQQNCQGINGFPTLTFIKNNGTKIVYNGERSVQAILSFINTNK